MPSPQRRRGQYRTNQTKPKVQTVVAECTARGAVVHRSFLCANGSSSLHGCVTTSPLICEDAAPQAPLLVWRRPHHNTPQAVNFGSPCPPHCAPRSGQRAGCHLRVRGAREECQDRRLGAHTHPLAHSSPSPASPSTRQVPDATHSPARIGAPSRDPAAAQTPLITPRPHPRSVCV